MFVVFFFNPTACPEHNNAPMNGWDCSPSPPPQAACSYLDQTCCADSLNPNQGSGYQDNPKRRLRDGHKVMDSAAVGSNSQEVRSHPAQLDSPQVTAQNQSSELCRCSKAFSETRDAGTQTGHQAGVETCDAWTQYSFIEDSAAKATGSDLCLPPVDLSVHHPATGRQSSAAAEPKTHTPLPGETSSGEKPTAWSKNTHRAAPLSGGKVINKFVADNTGGKVILQRPINPLLNALSRTDGRGKIFH